MTPAEYRKNVRHAKRIMMVTANFAINKKGQPKRRTIKISKRAAIEMLNSIPDDSTIIAQWADEDWRHCLIIGE